MANSLTIKIEVDDREAQQKLQNLDRNVDKIATTAGTTGQALSTYDKQVQTVVASKQALSTATDIATRSIITARESALTYRVTLGDLATTVRDFLTLDVQAWNDRISKGWNVLTGIIPALRAGLNQLAESAGLTFANLGLMGSAGLVVATAIGAWKVGEWIGNVTGLTKAVGAWETKTADAALKQQVAAAQLDVVHKAIEMGAPSWITYGDAVTFVNAQFAHLHDQAFDVVDAFAAFQKSVDDAFAKTQQAKQLGDFMRNRPGSVPGDVTDLPAEMAAQKAREEAAKRLADAVEKSTTAQAKYRDEVLRTVAADGDQVAVLRALLPGLVQGSDEYTHVRDAIGGMLEKGLVVPDMLKNWYEANKPVLEVSKDFAGVMTTMPGLINDTQDTLHNLVATVNEFHDGLAESGQTLSTVVIPAFSMLPNVVAQNTEKIRQANAATEEADYRHSKLHQTLKGVGDILEATHSKWGNFANTIVKGIDAVASRLADGDVFGAIVAGVTAVGASIVGLFHDVEEKVNPVRQTFVDTAGGITLLNEKAHAAGVTLDAMLNARTPEAYKKAIDDLNAALKFQDDAMKTLDDTVAKYGLTIDQLGPTFAKQKLDEKAAALLQDYQVLSAAGVDHNLIIQKMGPNLQEYVSTALRAGLTIPEQMRPVLQQMIELGLLTDASGVKMTDLSQLTFAETLDKKFTTLIDTINKLADAISRSLGGAIAAIPTNVDIHVGYSYDAYQPPEQQYASRGGYVTNAGVQYLAGGGNVLPFRARGTDTVPAMLTPGEGVVNRAGMRRLGRSGLSALNSGSGGGGGISVSIGEITVGDNMSAGEAGDKIGKIIAREIRKRGKRIA